MSNLTPNNQSPEATAALGSETKPHYIREQHNHGCQQFFGPVTGCIFAMPGSNVTQASAPATRDTKPKAKASRPSTLPKLKKASEKPRERMTFIKRGITIEHLRLLYQQLLSDGWLLPDTTEDSLLDLFSGMPSDCTLLWADKYGKSTLVFLFKYMEMEGVITVPKGFTIPNILMGHFTDRDGQFLTNLDHGDQPAEKAGNELKEFMRILKANANRAGRRAMRTTSYEEDED